MRLLAAICVLLLPATLAGTAHGQGSAPATLASRPPRSPAESAPSPSPKNVKTTDEKAAKPKESGSPAAAEEQIVTEIYADQAVFDSTKSIGVFTGHIVVTDPRFQIQG